MENRENNEDVMFTLCNFKYVFTDLVNDSLKTRGLDDNYFFGLIMTLRFLHGNGPAIIKDINKATQLGYSAINYVIKRGKALNLLKSAPSKTDGRARLISLTKKGERMFSRSILLMRNSINSSCLHSMTRSRPHY